MTAGLYFHVPFCARICPYCDFAVTTGGPERRRRFVEALCREIALYGGEFSDFDTVYFGGGTPSALDPEDLLQVLESARAHLRVAHEAFIFLEANPEDVTRGALEAWRSLGVATLSLGVQSFDTAALRFLGRRHAPDDARRSVALARDAGFQTVSVDLIYGLPGQDVESWRRDLETAVGLAPDHLSCYQLTIHEGTPFGRRKARGELREPSEQSQAELFRFTHTFLNDHGFSGYEVSNFAASMEHRSRHNLKYWNHTPYLGLGPSAHSFDGSRRFWNLPRLSDWEERVRAGERPVEASEALDRGELALEALFLGLRTYDGVDLRRYQAEFALDVAAANRPLLDQLAAEGLLELKGARLKPTLDGLAVADSLAARFD